jgi:hypothetical protein
MVQNEASICTEEKFQLCHLMGISYWLIFGGASAMVIGSKPIYFNQSEQICPDTLSTALQGEEKS